MSVRVNRETNCVEINCDLCQREAPPATEILAGGGLVNMGWWCSSGENICPDCEHPPVGWPSLWGPNRTVKNPVLKAGGRGESA